MASLFDPEPVTDVRRVSLVKLSGEIARHLAPIGRVAVDGEVSRPTLRGGRWWFVLKDRAAQVSVSLPAAKAKRVEPRDGERVRLVGRLSWASERGQLRFEAESIDPVGEGAIAALLAETRRRLAADGLLDRPRRPLPLLPTAVGVVCGADAAVRADIESVVADRFPGFPVHFLEVPVSGPGAPEAIAGALRELDERPEIEVIVLARGGGDATALLPFSDEALCRAIAAANTPVVSAIGHDGDRPLSDEVADVRCGTPSIAAARAVPDRAALAARLDRALDGFATACRHHLERATGRLAAVDRAGALAACVATADARLARAADALRYVDPRQRIDHARRRLGAVDPGAPVAARLAAASARAAAAHDRLEALSPRRVLERGYAVVRGADGTVIRDAAQLSAGAAIRVEVARGRIGARVEELEE